ncbi:hypothetical protein QQ045_003518 [Rhodiola kirilowii]
MQSFWICHQSMLMIEKYLLSWRIQIQLNLPKCHQVKVNSRNPIENCLWDVTMNQTTVHDIMLVGSIGIPKVHQLLQAFFVGKELCKSMNSNEVVAYAGTVQAMIHSVESREKNHDLLLLVIITLSLELDSANDVMTMLMPFPLVVGGQNPARPDNPARPGPFNVGLGST